MCKQQHNAGFTLLEIMLATLVLGMVVAMVSASLSGSIRVIDATMDQGEIYFRAQVAMERINEDLVSAVLPQQVEFIGSKDQGSSDGVLLSFASMAHIVFDQENGQPGMGLISYTVQPDREDEQMLVLLRSDVLYRPVGEEGKGGEDGEAFLLSDRLRSVQFSFIGRDGEESESWDTTIEEGSEEEEERRLPAAVSCRLEYWLDPDEETSITFQTTVVLPVGLIQPEEEEEPGAS